MTPEEREVLAILTAELDATPVVRPSLIATPAAEAGVPAAAPADEQLELAA